MPCTAIGIIKGVKGDTGAKGNKGDKGDPGDQGIQGPPGQDGKDGTTDTPTMVLNKIKNVDGSGSGLDADVLDGYDSSYFAKAEDLNTVVTHELNSKFMLAKRAGTVQLTIQDWDGEGWLNGRDGWQTIFTIPDGFHPAYLNSNVTHIYCPNLFGFHLRVRVNIGLNAIQVFGDHSDNSHFFGTVTWITDE